LAAHHVDDPGAPRAQGEPTAELVLAQSALDDHDAVSGQQRRVLEPCLGEEGAFDAATPVLEHDEGLALAALAHRADLSGDDRRDLLAPAAATALAVAVAALARVAACFPEGIELAEVGSDEGLELAAMRIE